MLSNGASITTTQGAQQKTGTGAFTVHEVPIRTRKKTSSGRFYTIY